MLKKGAARGLLPAIAVTVVLAAVWLAPPAAGAGLRSFLSTAYPTPCTSVSVVAAPPGQAGVGTTVNFTATPTCPNSGPSFQFLYLAPGAGAYTVGQAYSTTATWAFNTTGKPIGQYNISVWVKDSSSTGANCNGLGCWDAYSNFGYMITQPSCSGLSVGAAPPSTTSVGTTVTFTATGTCPNASPKYQFWYLAPGASAYVIGQAYSTTNTWAWNTTGKVPDGYNISVWVKDATSPGVFSNGLGSWDAYNNFQYSLTGCSALMVSPSAASPQKVGTPVTFTATGTCPNASPNYQFWTLAPGGSAYTIAQAYSTTNTFAWNTTGKVPGTWYVSIWVRDAASGGASSNSLGNWDAYTSLSYTLTGCTALSASPAPPSPSKVGTGVIVTGTGTCPNASPMYQFWTLAPGASAYTIAQAYSPANTFAWNTTGKVPGTWAVSVWVRDAASGGASSNSLGNWDAYTNFQYTLTGCTALSVSAVPANSQTHGSVVTFTATGTCPNPAPLYEFWFLAPGASAWTLGQAYSASNTWAWTSPTTAGSYHISVWVKDASSGGAFSNSFGTLDAYDNFGYTLT